MIKGEPLYGFRGKNTSVASDAIIVMLVSRVAE
jgi:hypothetical protein